MVTVYENLFNLNGLSLEDWPGQLNFMTTVLYPQIKRGQYLTITVQTLMSWGGATKLTFL